MGYQWAQSRRKDKKAEIETKFYKQIQYTWRYIKWHLFVNLQIHDERHKNTNESNRKFPKYVKIRG